VCTCTCVRVCERVCERDQAAYSTPCASPVCVCVCVCVYVCVCVRERETERQQEREMKVVQRCSFSSKDGSPVRYVMGLFGGKGAPIVCVRVCDDAPLLETSIVNV